MTIKELTYPSYSTAASTRRVSWPAILAGSAACLAISGCLMTLGMALGAVTVPTDSIVIQGIGTAATLWIVSSSVAAFCAGGWISARMAGTGTVSDSVLHGVTAWATALVALLLLWPSIGHVFRVVGMHFGPAHTLAFGRSAFLATFLGGVAAALGAAAGARLYMPMPVDQYERTVTTRRHSGAGETATTGVGR